MIVRGSRFSLQIVAMAARQRTNRFLSFEKARVLQLGWEKSGLAGSYRPPLNSIKKMVLRGLTPRRLLTLFSSGMFPLFLAGLLVAVSGTVSSSAAENPASEAFFENRIRPVLVEHCYQCHSVESGKSKGGLLLDTREGILTGGDTGAAVVPGKPYESLIFSAIRHDDPDLEMPPKAPKLSGRIIRDFEAWISAGAFDPREAATSTKAEATGSPLRHWSYRPLTKTEPPASGAAWPRTVIDRFVHARLEENDLHPSADADERTLVRRLYFDLTGLPPTPEKAEAFTFEELEKTVDDLLASEGFGVRWGRHWLDVVRYAESNGREANIVYPHAWRYRDYVIDAFNEDLPYDRFLIEQIAGDLLPHESDREKARLLIATGFLALGPKGLGSQDKPQFAADHVDEQLDALSRGFLAVSIACARCHDHKSDPVSMADYYSLIGIFRSTKTFYGTWIDSENNNGGELLRLPDIPGQLNPGRSIPMEKVDEMKAQLAELDEKANRGQAMASRMMDAGGAKERRENFNEALKEALRIYWTRGRLEGALARVDDRGRPIPLCMGVQDRDAMVNSPIYARGDLKNPLDEVERGVPALFGMEAVPPGDQDRSGRLALAHWLTDPDHPLTSRVMVNRIWSHLFGSGLVRTADNFGVSGEAPSHPELLDYLAIRFRENGWSVKALVREMVLSRTYRQGSGYREAAFRKDPDNRLLWRASRRRQDAEVLRDSMLAASGLLDPSPRPASLAAEIHSHSVSIIGFDKKIPPDLDGSNHRSIYLPVFRENLPDVLHLFDFAEPSLVVVSRDETNVPLQALYLMNSEFVQGQSDAFARRLMDEEPTREARIRRGFEICFNRRPDPGELQMVNAYFEGGKKTGEFDLTSRFCQALLGSAEFRIVE